METHDQASFGDLLRRYRVAAGLTQEELAERAGMSTRGIAALETGERRAPRRATVELLAEPERTVFSRTARRAIQVALLGVLLGGLSTGLLGVGLSYGLEGLFNGLDLGLLGGVLVGLAYGGYACLSHVALRLILWHKGYLPWNIVRFLDYCTEHIFLRKVGGGYIFIHGLLEYFATLDSPQASSPPREPVVEKLPAS